MGIKLQKEICYRCITERLKKRYGDKIICGEEWDDDGLYCEKKGLAFKGIPTDYLEMKKNNMVGKNTVGIPKNCPYELEHILMGDKHVAKN